MGLAARAPRADGPVLSLMYHNDSLNRCNLLRLPIMRKPRASGTPRGSDLTTPHPSRGAASGVSWCPGASMCLPLARLRRAYGSWPRVLRPLRPRYSAASLLERPRCQGTSSACITPALSAPADGCSPGSVPDWSRMISAISDQKSAVRNTRVSNGPGCPGCFGGIHALFPVASRVPAVPAPATCAG
jgi:hypothetical protein